MIDLRMTPDGDLDFEGFDLPTVTDGEQVAQRLRIKLRTFLGEVRLNTQAGVPWFEEILGVVPADLNRIEAILREQILNTPEVQSIEAFEVDYDGAARLYTMSYRAVSDYGPIADTVSLSEV